MASADSTLNDLFAGTYPPPLKRKRFSLNDSGAHSDVIPSTIKDPRISRSQALRLSGPTIEVVVGHPVPQSFHVHEAAITTRSPFFHNAMKPEWASQRPNPRIVELPDDDPEAFSFYLTYLYSGHIPILPDSPQPQYPSTLTSIGDKSESHHTLAYAYVLGERLMDTEFKNAIADTYVLYARGIPPAKRFYPSNEEIRVIYEGTRESCPLRKLLVDIWACRGKHEWIENDADLPKEFLVEVTKMLLKGRTGFESVSRPWKNSHEQYHDH